MKVAGEGVNKAVVAATVRLPDNHKAGGSCRVSVEKFLQCLGLQCASSALLSPVYLEPTKQSNVCWVEHVLVSSDISRSVLPQGILGIPIFLILIGYSIDGKCDGFR